MKKDLSYGIVPLQKKRGQWKVLLVQHQAGHWAFPKGHSEPGETPEQTAERELFEETGLKVKGFLTFEKLVEHYFFRWNDELIDKKVYYFIAEVSGKVSIQEEEIKDHQWLTLDEAAEKMTFKEGRKICDQVKAIVEA